MLQKILNLYTDEFSYAYSSDKETMRVKLDGIMTEDKKWNRQRRLFNHTSTPFVGKKEADCYTMILNTNYASTSKPLVKVALKDKALEVVCQLHPIAQALFSVITMAIIFSISLTLIVSLVVREWNMLGFLIAFSGMIIAVNYILLTIYKKEVKRVKALLEHLI